MNQIDPTGQRYSSNGARNATLTGNAKAGGPKCFLTCAMDPSWRKERKYERLFFLDEATALASGHRPCNRCRRAELNSFKAAWTASGLGSSAVAAIDDLLKTQRGITHQSTAATLPTGAVVDHKGSPHTVVNGQLLKWTPEGYSEPSVLPSGQITLLTPPAIIATLHAGYQPQLHPSAA